MLFKSVVSATLLASALAAPLQAEHHQHHKHEDKRHINVVTATQVVYVTAGAPAPAAAPVETKAPAPAPAAPAPAAPAAAPAAQDSPAPVGKGVNIQASIGLGVGVGTSPSSTASSVASSAPSAPPSSGNFNGGSKGVTYTPYADNGGCKSRDQIAKEIAALSGYEVIRLYGVDCDQVAAVLATKAKNQKVFAGIFDVNNIQSGISTLASAVKSSGSWDDIHTVSIGNELVNNGQANPGQIGGYLAAARGALKAAGYTGPIVSVDTFIAVINNPSLCELSDYIAVNAHAFFDGNVAADGAGAWVLQQIQRVASACGSSKKVLITETGWPSRGDSNNKAVPSKSNQQAAVNSIKSTCGDDVLLFTPYNDLWKPDGPFNAEKYWGFLSN